MMGQYYIVVNSDKKQYLDPHKLGDGLKLLEFGASAGGTMTALAVLLANGCGRGGGDLHGPICPECKTWKKARGGGYTLNENRRPLDGPICERCHGAGFLPPSEIVGAWAGDRIVIAGDYADPGLFLTERELATFDMTADNAIPDRAPNLYTYARTHYLDVSAWVVQALAEDPYMRDDLAQRKAWSDDGQTSVLELARREMRGKQ